MRPDPIFFPLAGRSLRRAVLTLVLAVVTVAAAGCASTTAPADAPRGARAYPAADSGDAAGADAGAEAMDATADSAPTAAEAAAYVAEAEEELTRLLISAERAAWVQANFITHDTEQIAAQTGERMLTSAVAYAQGAARFDGVEVDPDVRRKLGLLKTSLVIPAPADPAKTSELTQITTRLQSLYGTGKYCPEGADEGAEGDGCQDLLELSRTIAESRDPDALLEAWTGWRTISPAMRDDYRRMVELANEGSSELGYSDTGALWRSNYDMDPDDFAAELDRLYGQIRPLYEALHCHVRASLQEQYGEAVVPSGEPIPAHLLGNMWAQSWGNIYPLVAPADGDAGYDLTALLEEQGVDAIDMVRQGEAFFSSLGFAPLPETFWERSLFTKPADREVVCHASAWAVDQVDDLRIKMCIQVNAEDFQTIHHELGHNYYQRAYNELSYLYRNSANDGFHEAVGDTIALSVTPPYLVDIGYLDEEPPASKDIGLLLRDALDKIAFVPFGLLVDQWRWQVFSGEIAPEEYNQGWWELREKYQGVAAPVARSEADFDPGAKYHIPGNTPYTRYFLAAILQFDFHRSLCEAAGYEGPLNRCTIYDSQEAGVLLEEMLAMGQSRPWQEALETVTGSPQMDASAILDYFAPLADWLEEQNEGRQCGW